MEGLGATASVIAVAELAGNVATALFQYLTAVKNARLEIKRLQGELDSLSTRLQGARRVLDGPNGGELKTSQALRQSLDGLYLELASLEQTLRKKLDSGSSRVMRKFGRRSLKWPFESKEISRIIESLQRRQDTLSAALAIDQVEQVLDINQTLLLSKLPIVAGALFDSPANEHESRCHPETRVDLLQEILDWVDDPNGKSVFWLQGMAGTGKSTVARTVARHFVERGDLVATFSFKRDDRDRGNTSQVVTTIASQLVSKEPALAACVKRAIDSNHAIITRPMGEQFDQLILNPLTTLKHESGRLKTVVLVIDTLDECGREENIKLLLYQMSRGAGVDSIRWRAFITGRPEQPVRLGFNAIRGRVEQRVLECIPRTVIERDLTSFFTTEFARIRDDFNCLYSADLQLPEGWPGHEVNQQLIHMAIPLFIFAATVCRFVEDRVWSDPRAQLEKILQHGAGTGQSEMGNLDTTYLPILSQLTVPSKAAQQRLHDDFRDIVGSIVMLAEPMSANSLSRVLSMPRSTIDGRLMSLHSVLQVPTSPDSPIIPLHSSFRDFLIDPDKRETNPVWIDERTAHEKLAAQCLDLLNFGGYMTEDICDLRLSGLARTEIPVTVINSFLPEHVRYACLYWVHHTERSGAQLTDSHGVYTFLEQHFTHWLEALSLLGRVSDSIAMIRSLQSLVGSSRNEQLSAFLYDASRFILTFRSIIELYPSQVYLAPLIFAPKRSLVKQAFKFQLPEWILEFPGAEESEWTDLQQTLEFVGDKDPFNQISSPLFSPDGKMIACESTTNTSQIQLFDAATGEAMLQINIMEGFPDLAFSPDSRKIAVSFESGKSLDGFTVTCFDTTTGQEIQTWESESKAVAFSPDSNTLALARNRGIGLWNLSMGKDDGFYNGLSVTPKDIKFLPDGSRLLVVWGGWGGTIPTYPGVMILDLLSGTKKELKCDQLGPIVGFGLPTLSPSGRTVAWTGPDNTIWLQDAMSGQVTQSLSTFGNPDKMVFALDESLIGCIYLDRSDLVIWDTAKEAPRVLEYNSHDIAFSPDGQSIALALPGGRIELRDMALYRSGQTNHPVTPVIPGKHEALGESAAWQLCGHMGYVAAFALAPDGRTAASASHDHTVCLWDAFTGNKLKVLTHSDVVRDVVFTIDGKSVISLSGGKTISVWDIKSTEIKRLDWMYEVKDLIISPGDSTMALIAETEVHLCNPARGQEMQKLEHDHQVNQAAFSFDGRVLATAASDKIYLWDIAAREMNKVLHPCKDYVFRFTNMTFSRDGRKIAATALWNDDLDERMVGYSIILLWDIETGNGQPTFEDSDRLPGTLALSSDGSMLAAHNIYTGTVHIWDFIRHNEFDMVANFNSMSFSADNQYLETDRGRLDINTMKPHLSGFLGNDWLWQGENRVLWFPPAHRKFRSACHGSTFALGFNSGRVMLIRLDSD